MEKLREWWIDYHYQIVIGLVFVVILGALAWLRHGEQTRQSEPASFSTMSSVSSSTSVSSSDQPSKVCVDVKGAVKKPGIYYFKRGARVVEALRAAGGPLNNAEMKAVNLAKELADQQVVYVPVVGEQVPAAASSSDASLNGTDNGKSTINLNTASKEQLCQINGIGDKKADMILEYRQQHGQFKSVDELMQVDGFGEKTVAKLKDQVAV